MKRFLALIALVIMLSGVICMPASAASAASRVDLLCNVNSDGSCQVSMTAVLRIEAGDNAPVFPLPLGASNITMNGAPVTSRRGSSSTDVDISRITKDYIGEISMRFDYTLEDAVKINPEKWDLLKPQLEFTLPLLCGFDHPVEYLSYTINMPSGDFTEIPEYTSIYRQSSIASDLKWIKNGNQIIGASTTVLNDHEGITMSLMVPKAMFPTVSTYVREGEPELIPLLILAALALLYWLIFLFTLPLVPIRTSTPPAGFTAGEMGCRLTLAGGDLTMMVFTWAQLGYLLIHQDGNGRVVLHKRMDMGNERDAYENRVFKLLFGSRRTVDATGNQYAKLCNSIAEQISSEKTMYKGNSGNMKFFRWLCCASHVFCGICVAMNMASNVALQVVMAILLSIFAWVSAWFIQDIAYRTHLRGKTRVYIGLVCILIWILLGLLCGQIWIPLGSSLGQWALGYFAAYGGRRSDLGRRDAGMVLGFRRYVKHVPRNDINRLLLNDPDYFFNMAPYALALGVVNPFASAFGRRKMEQCPYLMTPVHGKRTAPEWAKLMQQTADMMDAKSRQMLVEQKFNIRIPAGKLRFFR